jgi:tetratricopeptide (TPR) repeat protein
LRRLDINTCVWGTWHLEVFRHVMLPTLLSPKNLPAVGRRLALRYRIATTPDGRKQIEAWPLFARLAASVAIDWVTDNAAPDIRYHIEWYRRSLRDAKASSAYCFMAYPDVAWNDGVLSHCADAIDAGKVAAAIPYIRVISETLVPEMAGRSRDAPVALSGGELVRLGMRHMHPLSAAAMAGARHALPSLEVAWRIPDQGLLLREISRELSLVDPARLDANQFWNTIATDHPDSLHVATDSDDMLMLSLAPLFKDFQAYMPNHTLEPDDAARISRHPDNDNPLIRYFAAHPIRLHDDRFDAARWKPFERRANRFVTQSLSMRECLGIWEAVRAAGCTLASKAISVALLATPLTRRWRGDGALTVYVPNDNAFGATGWEMLAPLLRPERARDLQRFILQHVAIGEARGVVDEARILRRLQVGPHRICIVDTLVVPLGPPPAAVAADPDAMSRGARLRWLARRLVRAAREHAITLTRPQRPRSWREDVKTAGAYPAFLHGLGIALDSAALARQQRAAAAALYQAGLYRHRLLFLHDLMTQFQALGGGDDPSPAFFEHCRSLVGGEAALAQAAHHYRLALQLIPDFAEAQYALGVLLRRAHRTRDACALFVAAAHAPPHANAPTYAHVAANAWRNLAEIHRDVGNGAVAEDCFRKALGRFGVHGVYQAEFARFFQARGRLAEAAAQYEQAMPYTHMYPCEFSEPRWPAEERLPLDLTGRPCDPLTPTIVAADQGSRLLYWWHVYLPMPPHGPIDAASIRRLKPRARLSMLEG